MAVYFPVTSLLQVFYFEIFILGAERGILCIGVALPMVLTYKADAIPEAAKNAFCLSLNLLWKSLVVKS